MRTIFFIAIYLAHVSLAVTLDKPCAAKNMGFGEVCMCDASYCDTVERPAVLAKKHFYHYLTSKTSPGFSRTTGTFDKKKIHVKNITVVFTIDTSQQHQEILGIGGSFSDAVGIAFNTLPEKSQENFMQSYFGTSGLEYSAARVPIGASDMSTKLYTYDDLDSPDDSDLSHFNLTMEDHLYKIPLIQRAIDTSPHQIRIVGCAFGAPAWMKTNSALTSGYIRKKYYDSWAKYHIKFLDAYAENGIKFWMVTGGNEVALPYFIGGSFMLGTLAMPDAHRQWVAEHLGPQLANSQHSDVKVLILDDMRNFAVFWMNRFSLDEAAWNVTAGVALHWYYDWLTPDSIPDTLIQQFPDKLIVYTETGINIILFGTKVKPFDTSSSLTFEAQLRTFMSKDQKAPHGRVLNGGTFLEPGSWERGALYAYNIIDNLNHWTSLYLDWNLALDTTGGPYLQLPLDAPVIINTTSGEFYKNPMFYAMGHFSKFMGQGSVRVSVDAWYKQPSQAKPAVTTPSRHPPPKVASNLQGEGLPEESSAPNPVPTFPPFNIINLPQNVTCTASTNPRDNSTTVIVLNTNDYAVNVTIADLATGNISTTIEPQSLNTFLYWPATTSSY